MIKIIEHDKKPSTVHRFTCPYCHCVFEAEQDDYTVESDNYQDMRASCKCPECGYMTHTPYRLPRWKGE